MTAVRSNSLIANETVLAKEFLSQPSRDKGERNYFQERQHTVPNLKDGSLGWLAYYYRSI